MTVLLLQRVPPGLRGELRRWLMEVAAGVFVGRPSALVRDQLWARCARELGDGPRAGSAVLVWRDGSAQGFDVRTRNPRGRYAERVDGVWLVRTAGANPPEKTGASLPGDP